MSFIKGGVGIFNQLKEPMIKIKCRYYNLTLDVTKKIDEEIVLPDGSTVKQAVDFLIKKYGYKFQQRAILTMDSMQGTVQRANVYLNNHPADYEYDYPDKLETKLKNGDTISFGSLIGGGQKRGTQPF